VAQGNSERISHKLDDLPNTFRDDQLNQIVNDLNEEDTGKGFSEVLYSGVFVQSIITWDGVAKTKKRTQTDFTYVGPFVTSITKNTFDEATGLTVVSSINATINYDAQKKVTDANITLTRI
jgi:hypothetical protein